MNKLLKLIGPTRTEFVEDDPDQLRRTMLGPDYLVLRDESFPRQDVVGLAGILEKSEDLAEIQFLSVDTRYQGQGYGRMLAREALSLCIDRNYTDVEVVVVGESSRKTLEPMGFEIVEEISNDRARLVMSIEPHPVASVSEITPAREETALRKHAKAS